MITSKIAANQTFTEVSRINKNSADDAGPNPKSGTGRSQGAEDLDRDTRTEISSFSTNRLHQFNVEFNSVLKSVRIADQAMAEIEANVEQMESEVQMFLKTYPPYPPGSEERIEMLKRIAGLRQQIEQLTLPQDPLARMILGNPSAQVPSGNRGAEISKPSTDVQAEGYGVYTGTGGLNIPDLSVTASDEQIVNARDALAAARKTIGSKREDLSRDTKQMIQSFR